MCWYSLILTTHRYKQCTVCSRLHWWTRLAGVLWLSLVWEGCAAVQLPWQWASNSRFVQSGVRTILYKFSIWASKFDKKIKINSRFAYWLFQDVFNCIPWSSSADGYSSAVIVHHNFFHLSENFLSEHALIMYGAEKLHHCRRPLKLQIFVRNDICCRRCYFRCNFLINKCRKCKQSKVYNTPPP